MAVFPNSVATAEQLAVAANSDIDTLIAPISAIATTITFATSGRWSSGQLVVIDSEIIFLGTVAGATATGCTRGYDGSVAATHAAGAAVYGWIVAAHHNLLSAEIVAIETALGAGYSGSQTGVLSTNFQFSRSASLTITTAGVYTFDFGTLPTGVVAYVFALPYTVTNATNNGAGAVRITVSAPHVFDTGMLVVSSGIVGVTGANGTFVVTRISYTQFDLQGSTFSGAYVSGGNVSQRPHYLYLSGGTGQAEACPIVSIAGAIVSLYVALPKSGSYTIASATNGMQEALYSDHANIIIPVGENTVHAPFTIDGTFQPYTSLSGSHQYGCSLKRGSSFVRGDVIRMINNCGPRLSNFAVLNVNLVQIVDGAAISGRNQIVFTTFISNVTINDERIGLLISGSNRYFVNSLYVSQSPSYVAAGNSFAGFMMGDGPWNTNADIYINNFGVQGVPISLLSPGQLSMVYACLIQKADGIYMTNGNFSAAYGIALVRTSYLDTMNYVLFNNLSIDNINISAILLDAGNTVGSAVFQKIQFNNLAMQQTYDVTQPQIVITGNQFTEGGIQFSNCSVASSAWIQLYLVNASYVSFNECKFTNVNYSNTAGGYAVAIVGSTARRIAFRGCDWDYVPSFGDFSQGILVASNVEDFIFNDCRMLRAPGGSCLTVQEGFAITRGSISNNEFANGGAYGLFLNATAIAPSTHIALSVCNNVFSNNVANSLGLTQYLTLTQFLLQGNNFQETTPITVASAATITLPFTTLLPIVRISGVAAINTINNVWGFKEVVLYFTGTASLTAAGNIAVAAGPFVAGQAITLIYDASLARWVTI